ncbi:ELMO/CED-12 family-domain-containing protein [Mucor mucedo]|uniref:ELMO/CED-12 family-domain-containing protein n=1 Tax=Mucor mucedo TaxID=29922 RepID=UPI00221F4354|nr:ELMO/CED-12 family-domain-containing protein [Mucor mucedo]KAI7892986.1 ELMO/CED-12 family-domain-containing protein [Mucor mucedo]
MSYDMDSRPSAQEAVKRLSSGFSLSENSNHVMSAKDDKSLKLATFSLQGYLKEKEFATEFLERGGLESLCDIIKNSTGNTLAYALNSFLSLMEHNSGWENLDDEFVARVAHVAVNEQLATIARPAIAILLKLISANNENTGVTCYGYNTIQKAIESETTLIPTLVDRLVSQEYLLSITSMSLLTAMMKYVTDEYRSILSSAYDNSNLKKNILRLMNNHPSDELKLMILEYQAVFIQNISMRHGTAVSMHNPRHINMLNDIWDAAHVDQIDIPGNKKWKKLGFTSEVPQREFGRTGVFGLEEMHLFVIQNKDLFAKLISEQLHRPEGKRCPFAKASIEVTDLLCSLWNITSTNTIAEFQPLLLSFNHVHSTTLQTYFRIFRDMEATTFDFSKVSALVRSQLRSAFASTKDIVEFDRNMFNTPYQVIRDRRLKELEWADDLLGRDAISNLRTRLSKQSYEFLKKQRISCLLEGAWFPCPLASNQRMSVMTGNNNANPLSPNPTNNSNNNNNSGSGNNSPLGIISPTTPTHTSSSSSKRWRYYKLSRSKKSILYGDFSEKIAPVLKSYEKLPHRIDLSSVSEIRSIRKMSSAGLNMSNSQIFHTSTEFMAPPQNPNLAFALYTDKNMTMAEFYCSSATQAAEWKDGFSMLLDKRFTSKETAELFHTLTEVGVKVKLLQIAGDRVEIPHGSIDVPPVPPGLGSGFFYDSIDT